MNPSSVREAFDESKYTQADCGCGPMECCDICQGEPAPDKREDAAVISQPTPGVKFDQGKPRMDLLDTYAIEQLALVLGFGAQKYAAWNWAKGIHYGRLLAACLRHVFAFMRGEDKDPESGLPHLAHAMCCLMFLLGMTQRHPDLDDRNKE